MSKLSDIGNLPSNFFPYSWKKLNIRPFEVSELKLMSRAINTGQRRPIIDAVAATIDVPIDEVTIGDYYYLLAWHKITSIPGRPWILTWTCPGTILKHKETGAFVFNDVERGPDFDYEPYEAINCGKSNTVPVHSNDLDSIQLPEGEEIVLEPGFDWPRIKIIDDLQLALANPDYNLVAPAIQWFAGDTWADKVKAFESSSTEKFYQALAYNDVLAHGIRETIHTRCPTCRAPHHHPVVLDVLNFFR